MYEFLDYRVQDVMSRPISISPETSLSQVERLLEEHGFNALPVVDASEAVVGLVSSLDLLRAFSFPEDEILPPLERVMERPVGEIMSRDVHTVTPRAPLTRVLEKLVQTGNRSFPVVEDDRLVGMVARRDLMAALRRADAGEKP